MKDQFLTRNACDYVKNMIVHRMEGRNQHTFKMDISISKLKSVAHDKTYY